MSRQFTRDWHVEVEDGNIAGYSHLNGFGEHSFGTDANVDMWGGPTDQQPEPDTGGYQLWVESSATTDDGDPAGIGAQTVEIHYLDTAGAEQTVGPVTMNGQTPVNTGITDCMFVQEHHVLAVGSNLVAVGDVDCTSGSGGTVVSRISAAGNQSMSTMRQVPAGKHLIVIGWHAYGTAATTKIANLRLRASVNDGALLAGVYHFYDSARLKDFATGHIPIFFKCPALSTVKVSGWTTGTIECTAKWLGILIDD